MRALWSSSVARPGNLVPMSATVTYQTSYMIEGAFREEMAEYTKQPH